MDIEERFRRQEALLEDLVTSVAVIAEGHGALVEGQRLLAEGLARLDARVERLDIKVDLIEIKIDRLNGRVDALEGFARDAQHRLKGIEGHLELKAVRPATLRPKVARHDRSARRKKS